MESRESNVPFSLPARNASWEQPLAREPAECFGLIGGVGPLSTVHYYQALIKAHAARMFIAHADVDGVLRLVAEGNRAGLAAYLAPILESLAKAGARFAAVSAVTPHLCMPELQKLSPIPLVDIVDVLISRLKERGVGRVALLGTRFTMETQLFGRLQGMDVIDLGAGAIEEVHRIYVTILANGRATAPDVAYLRKLCSRLHQDLVVEAIAIAGTELSVVLHEGEETFPLIDCARSHVEAIVERAIG